MAAQGSPEGAARESVILLHGLWMRRPAMWWLARRLRAAGFDVRLFAYATLWSAPERSFRRLAAQMRALGPGPVHLVGHSLGGLTALAMLERETDLPAGRVVTLGSPLAGSEAARSMARHGLRALVGRSYGLLDAGLAQAPRREVGSIAGNRPAGLGRLVSRFAGDNDGTVRCAETRIAGLTDQLELKVSHSGFLWSPEAVEATVRFLRNGRFAD